MIRTSSEIFSSIVKKTDIVQVAKDILDRDKGILGENSLLWDVKKALCDEGYPEHAALNIAIHEATTVCLRIVSTHSKE